MEYHELIEDVCRKIEARYNTEFSPSKLEIKRELKENGFGEPVWKCYINGSLIDFVISYYIVGDIYYNVGLSLDETVNEIYTAMLYELNRTDK